MRRTFRHDDLQARFERDGYVVVDVFTEDEVGALRDEVGTLSIPDHDFRFYSTIWLDDVEHRRVVDRSIRAFWSAAAHDLLDDHAPIFGNLMVKHPGRESTLGMHQDWTFVDEGLFRAVNLWTPLTPLEGACGPLLVVPGSHHWAPTLRGRDIASPLADDFDRIRQESAVELRPRIGQVAAFDTALIHGSGDNKTDADRLAVSHVQRPAEAEVVHLFADASGVVHRATVRRSFFVENGLFSTPDAWTSVDRIQPIDADGAGVR